MMEEIKLLSVHVKKLIFFLSTPVSLLEYRDSNSNLDQSCDHLFPRRHAQKKDTIDGVEIDTISISVKKLASSVAGKVIVESLGEAKCELETKNQLCLQQHRSGTSASFSWTACQDKGSHFLFFCSLFCFAFLLSFFSFVPSFCLRRGSHTAQDGLQHAMQLRVALNFSCLASTFQVLRTGRHQYLCGFHHTQ